MAEDQANFSLVWSSVGLLIEETENELSLSFPGSLSVLSPISFS